MADLSNIDDVCSGARRQIIDNINECGLLSYELFQQDNVEEDTNPIT